MEWNQWCRLCAKDNGSFINIFIKNENQFNVTDAVQRFFSIEIINTEGISQNVCSLCTDYLLSLSSYAEKIYKVQQLFLEIEANLKIGNEIETNDLRVKYNLGPPTLCVKKDISVKSSIIEFRHNANSQLVKNEIQKQIVLDPNIIEKNGFEELPITNSNPVNIKVENTEMKELVAKNCETYNSSVLFLNSDNSNDFDNGFNESCSTNSWSCKSQKQRNRIKNCEKSCLENKNKKRIYKTGEKNFECDECHQKFTRESNYVYHIKKSHKGLPPCEFCGKICKTKQKLRLHLELHLPPEEREKLLYKCPHCTKKFTQSAKVKEHVRAIHLQEKPFVCEQCGKNFASQSNLCSHKRTHDNQSRLNCSLCPKIFNNPHKLRFHIKHTHNSTGYQCSVCSQILKTRKTLRNHMLIHSDAKPFKCNYCGKDFKRDKNLQIHMITHSGLKPFACRFCSQSYANRSNCKKHERHSHPNEYDKAAAEPQHPQQLVQKKLPNIAQLETMLEQLKAERETTAINKISKS